MDTGMKMQSWKCFSVAAVSILVVGCGGGSGSGRGGTSGATPALTAVTYNYVAPTLNAQFAFARAIVDNSNNTINETFIATVTSVNADGSYVIQQNDPSHNVITANGTLYSVPTATINVNSSGQDISETGLSTGGAVTCTYTPHAAGPSYPLVVGDTWSSSWNASCGSNATVAYTQTGSVVNTESITVPAGTYTAIKWQSTISWTDARGTTHTDSRITWKDIAPGHSHTTIKEQDSYSLSGTIPTSGYAVTVIMVLQSQS